MEGHISQAYYAGSDQGLRYVSLMNIYNEHFHCMLSSFNHKFYHKRAKIANLGGYYLLFYKAGFRKLCHIFSHIL